MKKQETIDVKYGSLFPWTFRLVALLISIFAISLIIDRTVVAIILLILCGFVLTGTEGTVINTLSSTYMEYKSFYFIKWGAKIKYPEMEKLYVTSTKSKQKMYTAHTLHSSTFEKVDYHGFLKFTDDTTIKLLSRRKKQTLLEQLQKISDELQVPLAISAS